jgi:hypothetical protein
MLWLLVKLHLKALAPKAMLWLPEALLYNAHDPIAVL